MSTETTMRVRDMRAGPMWITGAFTVTMLVAAHALGYQDILILVLNQAAGVRRAGRQD
jgi:hypothetical protein